MNLEGIVLNELMKKNKQKIIDISWPISDQMTAYKDRRSTSIQSSKRWETDQVRESLITLGSHSGTHIDAPSHFLEHGKTVDAVDLNSVVGPCVVYDLTHCQEMITKQDLVQFAIQPLSRILLKTKNSFCPATALFDISFVYLSADAAQFLVEKQILCVGIDYLGIERAQVGHETHNILLSAGVTIIEGLRLGHVVAANYQMCCLPLLISGLDAAPARAILLDV